MAIKYQGASARWKTAMASAGPSYSAGIDLVTTSPTELAAQNVQGWLQGVTEAAMSGRFEKGLRKVSLAQWKDAAKTKGAARLGSGAAAAQPKMDRFFASFGPKLEQITAATRSMPKTTYEERQARMVAQSNAVHELKGNTY